MDKLSHAQAEIRAVLAKAPTFDASRHAEDTLAWLLRLEPHANAALALAALGHDIDHAEPGNAIRREDFQSYDEYKNAHARHGAWLLRELLQRCGVNEDICRRAGWLVARHECGGDDDANLLRDADNLSWLRVNLPGYLDREGPAETLRRCRWGYACLSPRARRHFAGIHHDDPVLDRLLRETVIEKRA